jgi:hypothetical protein
MLNMSEFCNLNSTMVRSYLNSFVQKQWLFISNRWQCINNGLLYTRIFVNMLYSLLSCRLAKLIQTVD